MAGTPRKIIKLEKDIAEEEVMLAARDIPGGKAPGPDLFPADIYERCPAAQGALAAFFTEMLERGFAPRELRKFYVAPSDKAGKDPQRCENK